MRWRDDRCGRSPLGSTDQKATTRYSNGSRGAAIGSSFSSWTFRRMKRRIGGLCPIRVNPGHARSSAMGPRAVSVLSALSAGRRHAGHIPFGTHAVPIWALDPKHSERSGYGFRDYETTTIAYRDTFGARLRRRYTTACRRQTSSPILQNLVFGTHTPLTAASTLTKSKMCAASVR